MRVHLITCAVLTVLGGCAGPDVPSLETPSDLLPPAVDLLPATPTVSCGACFPFETLPASLRTQAEEILLKALDAEALYTIAADLKPMSSGFVSLTFPAAQPEPAELIELRQILASWHCTDAVTAGVQVFNAVYEGERYADAVVFHRQRFDATVATYATLFDEIGVRASDPPLTIVEKFDADPTTRRFSAYGHLFGYPAHAVEFFAQAAEEERMTGKFVERDFIHIPTHGAARGRFVYAVPKGHTENDDDRALRSRAAPVLARYRALRDLHIGAGKDGVLALVRDWFDDGSGRCSPRHALTRRGSSASN